MSLKENNEKQIETLKKLPNWKRLSLAFGLHDLAWHRVFAEQKRQNPALSPPELLSLVSKRFSR